MKYQRQFNVNDSYFSEKTNENCYWAGFIAADGTLLDGNKLVIAISSKDRGLLESFKKDIGAENNIGTYTNNGGCEYCKISIYSKRICEDLKKNFNIVQFKTFVLKPPNLTEKNHIDYYIKGYIDGDGCVSLANKFIVHVTGTKSLLEWFNLRFSEILGRETKCLSKRSKTEVYQTRYEDRSGRNIFLHYYNLEKGLDRKWSKEKFEYCFNWKKKVRKIESVETDV